MTILCVIPDRIMKNKNLHFMLFKNKTKKTKIKLKWVQTRVAMRYTTQKTSTQEAVGEDVAGEPPELLTHCYIEIPRTLSYFLLFSKH